MSSPNPSEGAAPPISDVQRLEIMRGEERMKKLAFAGKLASFNGVVIGVFAFISLLSALFDVWSLLLAAPLAAIAFIELRGSQQLARLERGALELLAGNQFALILLVAIYAALQIHGALNDANPLDEMLSQSGGLAEELGAGAELGDFDELYRSATIGFYGLVITLTALSQGACAFYYWTRRKHLDALLTETPPWVIDWLRARKR